MDMDDYESLPPSTPLYVSCCAGALAGVAEHCAMYPVDSVKVCIFISNPRVIFWLSLKCNGLWNTDCNSSYNFSLYRHVCSPYPVQNRGH